ncbi:type I-E CRISPR-associated endoribonuclease Cas2 [Microtetraspora malaysiensis]|uniref:type I-E CRISPR-associated endoribonuclease Cas2 n=1 Tax=Microtetraspora malaysiensis TaxID=161358 RepID=UPI003D8B9CEC
MAVLINTADNEQGFVLRTSGQRRRHVIDFDGLQLIKFAAESLGSSSGESKTSSAIVK